MSRAMTPVAIELDRVSRSFGGLLALAGVSLRVTSGERHALIGPNGAGKTTLFKCIAGSLRPTAGHIRLFGEDITAMSEPRRVHLGLARTYQITTLFPRLTARENVFLAVQGCQRAKWALHRTVEAFGESVLRANAALERVGLGARADDPVDRLSYGERRQLELAMAMAALPRVLLLDEPMAGLSPVERERVGRLIADVPRDVAVLLIEHNIDVVLQLADRITVLHHGSVIAEGSPEEVRTHPEARKVYLGA